MKKFLLKTTCLSLAFTFFTSSIPFNTIPVFAETITDTLQNIETNISSNTLVKETNVSTSIEQVEQSENSTTEETNLTIDIDTTLVSPRTINFLDVAKIVIANNSLNSDYQLNLTEEEILNYFPEYKLADIKEYVTLTEQERNNVIVENNVDAYAKQLEYLINNNILTRYNNYIYNNSNVTITDDRYIHTESSTTDNTEHKYYDPDSRVSKTDFITNLFKTQEVHQSRLIGIQTPYSRINQNLITESIDTEPLETSPYQDYMGDLGIDSALSDVILNHGIFRQLNILATNDVTEYYLLDALNSGIIDRADIGGVEGEKFLATIDSSVYTPGSWNILQAVRQQYVNDSELSSKETDFLQDSVSEDYYDYLSEFLQPVKDELELLEECDGLSYPWGNSYYYSVGACTFGDYSSTNGVEIIKRPSMIEVIDGFYDPNREDLGYQYFNNEALSLAEAYVLAYKFLLINDTDSKLPQQTVDAIVSSYGLDFQRLNGEELEAVQYLIAKGIINPNNQDIFYSTDRYITNKEMIDILYRIKNKDARYELTASLSDLDKDMLSRGYYQNTINVNTGSTSSASVTYSYSSNGETWTSSMIEDRKNNLSSYDYIYIKLPSGFDIDTHSYYLIGNDSYRVSIPAYNYFINGGNTITSETIDKVKSLLKDGETAYSTDDINSDTLFTQNSNRYVFKTSDGDYWVRYILPTASSSNVIFKIMMGSKIYSIDNISGEGIYYLKDENSTTSTFEKVSISKVTPITKRLIKVVIENDEAMRLELQRSVNDVNKSQSTSRSTTYNVEDDVSNSSSTSNFSSIFNLILPKNIIGLISSILTKDVFAEETNSLTGQYTQASDLTGTIKIGPYSKTEFENLTFSGSSLINVDSSGNYSINTEISSLHSDKLRNMTIDTVIDTNGETVYYIEYKCLQTTIDYELATLKQQLDITFGNTSSSVSGYAQISSSTGDRVNLISENNFVNLFNIEVISDKLLQNTKTGQKAFLNDTESFTMIGNNITKYPQDKMFVIALGDEKFYNLDIILELVNDTKALVSSVGSNTDITISDEYNFASVVIKNNNSVDLSSTQEEIDSAEVMDTSYIIYDPTDSDGEVYINLSALSYKASNVLFFRDTTLANDLKMLLVYYPKETDIYNETVTDNGIIASTMSNTSVNATPSTAIDDFSTFTKVLSSYFFTAGGYGNNTYLNDTSLSSIASNVLPTNYQYDIYFLVDGQAGNDQITDIFTSFVEQISSISESNFLLQSARYGNGLTTIASQVINGIQSKSDSQTNVMFDILRTTPTFNPTQEYNESLFYIESGSNNLYYRIQKTTKEVSNGKTNVTKKVSTSTEYLNIFKNRLYFVPTSLDVNSSGGLNSIPELRFRSAQYYNNTPVKSTPLEALPTSRVGEINTSDGRGTSNLESTTNLPLSVIKNNSSTTDKSANVLVPVTSYDGTYTEMALFTTITMNGYLKLSEVLDDTQTYNTKYSSSSKTGNALIGGKQSSLQILNASMMGWLEEKYKNEFPNNQYAEQDGQLSGIHAFQPIASTVGARYSSYSEFNDEQIAQTYTDTLTLLNYVNKGVQPYIEISDMKSQILGSITGDLPDTFATLHFTLPSSAIISNLGLKEKKLEDALGLIIVWTKTLNRYTAKVTIIKQDDLKTISKPSELLELLRNLVGSKSIEIYFAGKFPIPAGTTIVDEYGMLKTSLSSYIRTEVNFISDINNALLTRLKLSINDVTFLSEVPKGSVVNLGTDTRLVKTSNAQGEPSVSKTLTWENLALLPTTSDSTYVGYESVSDYTIMYNLLLRFMSMTIPLTEGSDASNVTVGQAMGGGLWSLPDESDLNLLLSNIRTAKAVIENGYNREILTPSVYIWGKGQSEKLSDGSISLLPSLYKIQEELIGTDNSVKVLSSKDALTNKGFLIPLVNLAPTVIVEYNSTTSEYDIVGYIDPSFFNLDLANEYVEYLKTRNTSAYSPIDILSLLAGYDMSGEYFKKWELGRISLDSIINFFRGLSEIIPLLLGAYWFIVAFIVIMLSLPIPRTFIHNSVEYFNADYIKWITFGLFVYTDRMNETKLRFLTFSFILWTVVAMLYNNLLIKIIIDIWSFIIK